MQEGVNVSTFRSECDRLAAELPATVEVVRHPSSIEMGTDTWRVVIYEGPTGHRFAGVKGAGRDAIKALSGAGSLELLELVSEKWRWLQDNPMYKSGWGSVSRRDAQRDTEEPEVEVQPSLRFGDALPDGAKVTRRKK